MMRHPAGSLVRERAAYEDAPGRISMWDYQLFLSRITNMHFCEIKNVPLMTVCSSYDKGITARAPSHAQERSGEVCVGCNARSTLLLELRCILINSYLGSRLTAHNPASSNPAMSLVRSLA